MKSILDPSFRYRASFDTDLQKTFERVRRAQRRMLKLAAQPAPAAPSNVASITRLTDCSALSPRVAHRS